MCHDCHLTMGVLCLISVDNLLALMSVRYLILEARGVGGGGVAEGADMILKLKYFMIR